MPAELTSAGEIMLNPHHPMLVWWRPELTRFYNDAYTPVTGKLHPSGWPMVGLAEAVMWEGCPP